MYLLKIQSTRRSTLAVHQCESYADLRGLLAIYRALGYQTEALQVEDQRQNRAA